MSALFQSERKGQSDSKKSKHRPLSRKFVGRIVEVFKSRRLGVRMAWTRAASLFQNRYFNWFIMSVILCPDIVTITIETEYVASSTR